MGAPFLQPKLDWTQAASWSIHARNVAMRGSTIIYRLSIALNVLLLAAAAIWMLRRPGSDSRTLVTNGALPSSSSPPTSPAVAVTTPSLAPGRTNFHWSQVESTDYLIYIRNLRAIGCPEETVRDIIVADVNKLFAPRYAALAGTAPETAWWGHFNRKRPVRAELLAQLRALDGERRALLERETADVRGGLEGFPVDPDGDKSRPTKS